MAAPTAEFGTPTNITASSQIGLLGTPQVLIGFYVNSTTAGTLVLRNGGSGGTAVSGTITPAIGWNSFPAGFPGGLYATVGGTLDVTLVTIPGQA
jgi:hypothetical protein